MAFYVAVVLDAALLAFEPDPSGSAIGLIWGTSIGLAVAHVFAFRLSGSLLGEGLGRDESWATSAAQLGGAVLVAALASVPVLVLPESIGFLAGAGLMELFVGVAALAVGRTRGASWPRSIVFAVIVTLLAGAVAALKNALIGH